jgi:uncharacterized protein YaaR (DUF327 family)
MKILPKFIPDRDKLKSKKDKKDVKTSDSTFSDSLKNTISENNANSVEAILDSLNKKERELSEKQTLIALNEYKKLIKQILRMAVENGFETKKINSRRGIKEKEFFIVNKIDEKLRELSLAVTSPQSGSFAILKQCEEIRGLIFDLLK